MGLSPSTLFHFTKKKGLKGILTNNFRLNYCFEKLDHIEKQIKLAIPMVSFCDIKISEIVDHAKKYGYYGLGLSKEWALEKGLNPVIYLNRSSNFSKGLITTVRKIVEEKKVDLLPAENFFNIADILRYSKFYEGELNRKGKVHPKYRFADEREWRYVPKISDDLTNWLTVKDYNDPEKKRVANDKLKNERLEFSPDQIMYIIVKDDKEIEEVVKHIKKIKGNKYSDNQITRLNTRILSFERIKGDF